MQQQSMLVLITLKTSAGNFINDVRTCAEQAVSRPASIGYGSGPRGDGCGRAGCPDEASHAHPFLGSRHGARAMPQGTNGTKKMWDGPDGLEVSGVHRQGASDSPIRMLLKCRWVPLASGRSRRQDPGRKRAVFQYWDLVNIITAWGFFRQNTLNVRRSKRCGQPWRRGTVG